MQGLEIVKNPRALFEVLKETYSEWSEDKASRLAAALAYYTAFSVAPLLLISITVAGLVFGREAAEGQVVGQLQGAVGPDAAAMIETSIANSQDTGAGSIAAIIGLATLIWSASNVFAQLQDALNTIWEVAPDPNAGILGTVKRRFLSMTMVLGIGFMLLVSLALSAVISVIGSVVEGLLPGGATLWQFVNFGLSFGIVTLLFAAIYKVLPDVDVAWSDVWIGGAVTALLFSIGKLLIGLYLGYASVGSTFGAAGSLMVFLLWVYYSAQILLFGAEFTQVYARRYGSRITPSEGAIPLTDESRATQGIPSQETVEKTAREHRGERQPERTPAMATVHANGGATVTYATGHTNGHQNGHVNGADERAHANGHANGKAHAAASRDGSGSKKRPRGSGGTKGAPDAVKKAMWTGLVAGSMAAGAAVAHQASASIWRGIFHEDPPAKNG